MEQNNDLKQELQQELQGLQNEIAQHSTFNSDVWRRSVKRHSRNLFWVNICLGILFAVGAVYFSLLYFVEGIHFVPQWMMIALDIFFAIVIVYAVLTAFNLIRPRTNSLEGLRSLRETVDEFNNYKSRMNIVIYITGGFIIIAIIVYKFTVSASEGLKTLFLNAPLGLLVGYLVSRLLKKDYRELGEEVDELLKEE